MTAKPFKLVDELRSASRQMRDVEAVLERPLSTRLQEASDEGAVGAIKQFVGLLRNKATLLRNQGVACSTCVAASQFDFAAAEFDNLADCLDVKDEEE